MSKWAGGTELSVYLLFQPALSSKRRICHCIKLPLRDTIVVFREKG